MLQNLMGKRRRRRRSARSNFMRLVITYFGVLIPILFISFTMTESTIGKLNLQERIAGEQRMTRTIENVKQMLFDTKQNSIRFSNISALRPYAFFQSPKTEMNGVELLKIFTNFDSNIKDIVLYFGTGVVYGSSGMSELSTYFRNKGVSTGADIADAIAAIRSESDQIVLLDQSVNDGLFLLHYSNRNTTAYVADFSVNFVISVQQFAEKLQSLMGPTLSYVNVTLPNGKKIHFKAENDQFSIVPDEKFPENMDAFTITSGDISFSDLHVEALHDTEKMFADIRHDQIKSYMMIAGGLVLSMILVYIFSKIRVQQITWLEMLLQGANLEPKKLNRGEFAGLHNLILTRNKIGELQGKNLEYSRRSVRQQLSHMLTKGGISDENTIKSLLKSCDIEWTAKYYFIAGILFPIDQEVAKIDKMEQLLIHDLSFRGTVGDHTVLYCLAEAQDTDLSQKSRLTLGRSLQEVLISEEIPNARIAFSAIFAQFADASRAYAQARKTMEYFVRETTPPGQCMCWDDIIRSETQKKLVILDTNKLVETIQSGNSVEAGDELIRLSATINAEGEDDTHRAILRAQLLSQVANALHKPLQSKFWNEVSTIHLENSTEFEQVVRSAMVEYVIPQESNDLYAKLSAYVDANYASCDLTAEQVAKMGKITPQYLTRLFKTRSGLSYMDYVTQLRMKKACQLLRTTNLAVTEVVRQSGYIDASSFRRKFRNVFNCGVSEYRDLANPPQIPPEMLPFNERPQSDPDGAQSAQNGTKSGKTAE